MQELKKDTATTLCETGYIHKIKRITSFTPRTLATLMENRAMPPPSSHLRSISKQKPMKRTIVRKHKLKKHTRKDLFLKKVVPYLISDCYMYNPLVSPQPTFDFPPPKQLSAFAGGQLGNVAMPIRESQKKLIAKVVDFLEADCYLYSPLLSNEHVCSKSRQEKPNSGHLKTHGGSESTETHVSQMEDREREAGELHARPIAYRESLNRIVRRNFGTKSNQGALLETEFRKMVVD